MADERPVARTKHCELSLDQLAEIQPGLGRLMPEVSERFWILYYAAKEGNWGLAQYQLNGVRNLLRIGAITRPKMANYLNSFSQGHLSAVEKAIAARDLASFEQAYQKAVEGANAYHNATGHAEIEWKLPPDPPQHLELRPRQAKDTPNDSSQ